MNEPPSAVNDAATKAEDSGATAIDVLANDTDVDGGAISIQSASDPANGTVLITGGGSGLTYAPDADYCNSPPGTSPDTFTYTLNGGSQATVSVTVTCVDEPCAGRAAPRADRTASGSPQEVQEDEEGRGAQAVQAEGKQAPRIAHEAVLSSLS